MSKNKKEEGRKKKKTEEKVVGNEVKENLRRKPGKR